MKEFPLYRGDFQVVAGNEQFVDIGVGEFHTIVLSKPYNSSYGPFANMYVWGLNSNYQLCLPEITDYGSPQNPIEWLKTQDETGMTTQILKYLHTFSPATKQPTYIKEIAASLRNSFFVVSHLV